MASEKKEYTGSCHCKAFTYKVRIPQPFDTVQECNCSICEITGTLGFLVPQSDFQAGDEGQLNTYSFNKKELDHKFCKTCGTSIFANVIGGKFKGTVGINARTLHDVNLKALKIEYFDGRST